MTTLLDKKSSYMAISYDTATFADLKQFMLDNEIELGRIEPADVDQHADTTHNYINLIITDFSERKRVSDLLDQKELTRFSYIHPSSVISGSVAPGCFVYPGVVVYTGTSLGQDVIMHASCAIGHRCVIGNGSFFSGGVVVGGSSTIGKFNKFMIGAIVHDKINICDNVTIGADSVVRKNINEPGVYSSLHKFKKINSR